MAGNAHLTLPWWFLIFSFFVFFWFVNGYELYINKNGFKKNVVKISWCYKLHCLFCWHSMVYVNFIFQIFFWKLKKSFWHLIKSCESDEIFRNVMLSDRFISSFLGKNCDINIDDCSPNPCQHGSSCIDLVNGYNCSCSDEWMGKNCTDVYDACSFAPCKNGATCSTTKPRKDYSCACISGFSGHDCGTNIDDCKPDSCVDPFVCHDLVNNYTCACPTGLWMFTHI